MSDSSPTGKSSVTSKRLKLFLSVDGVEGPVVSPTMRSLGQEMVAEFRKICCELDVSSCTSARGRTERRTLLKPDSVCAAGSTSAVARYCV